MSGWFWARCGALLAFLGVAMGAFGAHMLKARLAHLDTTPIYQTAVQYQMYHALALVLLGALTRSDRMNLAATVAGISFTFGILVFSGTLYAYATTGQKWLGAITPIGGVAMLVGWIALAFAVGGNAAGRE
jgi:uncharacterized membrane protein YgdD (TMEM256/DUF423 family)